MEITLKITDVDDSNMWRADFVEPSFKFTAHVTYTNGETISHTEIWVLRPGRDPAQSNKTKMFGGGSVVQVDTVDELYNQLKRVRKLAARGEHSLI